MKKFLLIGCLGVPILLIIGVVAVGAMMGKDYDVSTSVVINAAPEDIFPHFNNLSRWPEWSVWTKEKYPEITYSYDGPAEGVGAVSSWDGPQAGQGTMTITAADPKTGIDYDLTFEGFEPSQGILHMKPVEGGTEVTMGLKGAMPFPMNMMIPIMKTAMVEEFGGCLQGLKTNIEG